MSNLPSKIKHVLSDLFADSPYPCQSCGTEMELPGVCEECYQREERRLARQRCHAALSTLPPTMKWASFANALLRRRVKQDDSDPIVWCERAIEVVVRGPAHNVVLLGPTGVGKTALACAMARRVVELRPETAQRMMFASCVDMSMCRREAKWGEGRPKSLERARQCSLLIFDDLNQETSNTDVAMEIIHARYDAKLPTIFTTWASSKQIAERYGGGTSRRVFELAAIYRWDEKS